MSSLYSQYLKCLYIELVDGYFIFQLHSKQSTARSIGGASKREKERGIHRNFQEEPV